MCVSLNLLSNLLCVYSEGEPQPPVLNLDHYLLQINNNLYNMNNKLEDLEEQLEQTTRKLEESKHETVNEISYLQTSLNAAHSKLDNMNNKLQVLYERQQQTASEISHLNTTLNACNSKLDSTKSQLDQVHYKLDSTLSKLDLAHSKLDSTQYKQDSTHSKLDSLTATTAQLSSDHQQIQANISDVECLDVQESLELHQTLQNNLTHQLEKIKYDITHMRTNQESYTCGGTGGWRRVVYLDMINPSTTCPSGWNMTGYSKRTCGRATDGINICDSATFPVRGGEYTRICGRIRAYQWGRPEAFVLSHIRRVTTIDGVYAEGVSLTHGTPRNHIWTFAAGATENYRSTTHSCPCDTTTDIRIPSFVGEDYFCESGINGPWGGSSFFTLHSDDTLWDGQDCLPSSTCCSRRNPPYFVKQLPSSTTDDIEARICLDHYLRDENIAIELVELYIQ